MLIFLAGLLANLSVSTVISRLIGIGTKGMGKFTTIWYGIGAVIIGGMIGKKAEQYVREEIEDIRPEPEMVIEEEEA